LRERRDDGAGARDDRILWRGASRQRLTSSRSAGADFTDRRFEKRGVTTIQRRASAPARAFCSRPKSSLRAISEAIKRPRTLAPGLLRRQAPRNDGDSI
jgi:hypothetical protein